MAFLGISIKNDTGRLFQNLDIPGVKEGLSDLHITLVCFEDDWAIEKLSKALEAVYDVVADVKPFSVKVDKISCFPMREGKKCPIIAKVTSDELQDLNKKIKKEFDKRDIAYDKKFKEYNPHITLSYADEEIKDSKIDTIEVPVHEINLLGGNKGENNIFITFPLRSIEMKKNASLINSINMFYKLNT
jgi:2'-5' RNA ligase